MQEICAATKGNVVCNFFPVILDNIINTGLKKDVMLRHESWSTLRRRCDQPQHVSNQAKISCVFSCSEN